MDLEERFDDLLELAHTLGIDIRREPLGGDGGGLCQLRGKRLLFVDTSADLETRYERTLHALAGLPDLDDRYIRPEIRDEIDALRRKTP